MAHSICTINVCVSVILVNIGVDRLTDNPTSIVAGNQHQGHATSTDVCMSDKHLYQLCFEN